MIFFEILLLLLICFIVINKLLARATKKTQSEATYYTVNESVEPKNLQKDSKNSEDPEYLELISYTASKGTPKKGKRINAVKKQINNPTEDRNEVANTPTKNKWLYPSDELGTLEEGVEWNSRTYTYDQKDKDNGFEIN